MAMIPRRARAARHTCLAAGVDGAGSPHPSAGSTLVEVVMAMVISAIGLLALQSLATAAIVSGGIASWNTRAATTATYHLELLSAATGRGTRPGAYGCAIEGGSVTVDVSPIGDARLIVAEVTVLPDPPRPSYFPVAATHHGYSPEPFREVPPPACP
jgi:hypothetical protein